MRIIQCCKSCGVLFEWEQRADRRAPDCPQCGLAVDEPDPAKLGLPKGPAVLLPPLDSAHAKRMAGAGCVGLLGAIVLFSSIALELWPGLLVGLGLVGLGITCFWIMNQRENKKAKDALAAADSASNPSGPGTAPAGQPAFKSVLISVADIERIDKEIGEIYLHCPKCGEEERVNDAGKLMLSQGNNVFANYECKKCSAVFDGAQNLRNRCTVPAQAEVSESSPPEVPEGRRPGLETTGLDLEDFAIIIIGPFAQKWPAALTSQGVRGQMILRQRLDNLVLPAKQVRGLTLIFAHCIPSRKGRGKSERDMQEWAAQLMSGAGFTASAFHHPDIAWYGDKADDQVDLKLFWERLDSQEGLRIAKALEGSFLKSGGADSYS